MIHLMRFFKGGLSGRLTRFVVWSVLPIGLIVTLAVTVYIKVSADRLAERDFIAGCSELQRILANRLDDHARILLRGAALFNASETVTRKEWRLFAQSLKVEKQLPGVQGFGYSLVIRVLNFLSISRKFAAKVFQSIR
jgi:CHASE1-domain containing sensor protein